MTTARHSGGTVLVFGENRNDAQSVKELLLAANSELDPRRVKALPRPMSLTKGAKQPAVRRWVDELAAVIRAHRAGGPIAAVVVHRDADEHDPHGMRHAELGLPVVPVQMIEAWWLLFPDAVEAVRPSAWGGRLPRKRRDVEVIVDPKAELCRLTRSRRAPEYSEADSPVVALHIRRRSEPPMCACPSYERLVVTARSIR